MNTLYLIPTPLAEDTLHTIPAYVKEIVFRCDVFIVEELKTARRFIKAANRDKNIDECGITSNQDGFNINRKKINAINKKLWGDDK